VAFGRCRKCRGGAPTGERVPLDARLHPHDAATLKHMRLPAFRFLSSFVIASQRVRPEVAGPMTSSAKQSSATEKFWIASSLRSSQ
jgi:hypothetical protein